MNKQEIIDQYIEDQKSINWSQFTKSLHGENDELKYYFLNENTFEVWSDGLVEILNKANGLVFSGTISNQGQLRILMKMLNIK